MLAEQHGKLGGSDADERREILRWLFFDNHKFTSYFATWRFMKSFAASAPDPAVAAFLKSRIDSAFGVVDKHLAGRAYMVGDAFSIADISLSGYMFYPAEESGYVLEERFPNLAAWRDRLTQRARLGRSVRSPSGRAHRPALVMAAERAMADFSRLAVLRAAPSRVRERARRLGGDAVGHAHGDDRADVDAACRALVRSLGAAGWLAHAVAGRAHGGDADAIDTRAICLARETLARHDGLADFAFAMQGLGSGAISLAGTPSRRRATCRGSRAARRSPRSRCPSPTPAPTSPRWRAPRARDGDALRPRRREDLDLERRHRRLLRRLRAHRRRNPAPRARAASAPSSSTPARRASRSPSAST